MKIEVNIDKKLMSKNKEGNREELINYIISYPNHRGRIRHNTEDEIRKLSENLKEVIKEVDKWHELNPVKEKTNETLVKEEVK